MDTFCVIIETCLDALHGAWFIDDNMHGHAVLTKYADRGYTNQKYLRSVICLSKDKKCSRKLNELSLNMHYKVNTG